MQRLAAAALIAAVAFAGTASAGTVNLTLDGVQPRGGKILVTVQSRDQFMKSAQTSGAVLDGSSTGRVKVALPNVPAGDYAISVLHDADQNWGMTMGADGKPAEGWTMNKAGDLRATPTFDQVKVSVDGDASLTQTMMYPK